MSKLDSGAAYGASAGTIANGLLTRLSPDEWSAVGVLAGIVVALLTLGINWYYKRKATLAQIKALQRWPTRARPPREITHGNVKLTAE
ncbi:MULTISPECIES: class II holin family protein [Pantoea]|uniref:class II holin family protein n=1 Tax=Pantoea TaxID=53335 RepID=UPI0035E3F1DB